MAQIAIDVWGDISAVNRLVSRLQSFYDHHGDSSSGLWQCTWAIILFLF